MLTQEFEEVVKNTFWGTQKLVTKEEFSGVPKGSDEYLDMILQFKESFRELNSFFATLNSNLEKSMTEDSDSTLREHLNLLQPLYKTCISYIPVFEKSEYYEGVKSVFDIYREEVEELGEFIHDIEFKTKTIHEDDDFQSLIAEINAL